MKPKEFVKKQQTLMTEILMEIRNSKSTRVEILLLTNFVESILKDFIEYLFETNQARKIPRKRILLILEERMVIPNELAYDVGLIFKIRDFYAHNLSLNEANREVEKILPKMNLVKNVLMPKVPTWKERDLTRRIPEVADSICAHLLTQFDFMINETVRVRVPTENK